MNGTLNHRWLINLFDDIIDPLCPLLVGEVDPGGEVVHQHPEPDRGQELAGNWGQELAEIGLWT